MALPCHAASAQLRPSLSYTYQGNTLLPKRELSREAWRFPEALLMRLSSSQCCEADAQFLVPFCR